MASLKEKKAFFNQIESFFVDDELDAVELARRKRFRGFFPSRPKPEPLPAVEHGVVHSAASGPPRQEIEHRAKSTPRRVASDPIRSLHKASSEVIRGTPVAAFQQKGRLSAMMNSDSPEVIIVDDTPRPESARPALRVVKRSDSTPVLPSKRLLAMMKEDSPSPSISLRKRKREPALKLRPEGQQIFKGLSFYYVPDNDIAPARRLRITKAREYGANWTRSVIIATHIVVDKTITFKDIENILASASRANPPKLVNEDYPIDCVQFRALLQPDQKKYLLKGQPRMEETNTTAVVPSSSEESTRSLQLKPPPNNPKRWDYVPPAATPSRSEESLPPSRPRVTPMPTDSQPVVFDLEQVVASPIELSDENSSRSNSAKPNLPKQSVKVSHRSTKDVSAGNREGAKDELSEYIDMLQQYKDLPLDPEDDDGYSVLGSTTNTSDESGSEGERSRKKKAKDKPARSGRKDLAFEDKFACNSAGAKDLGAENPNSRTIEVLQQMANYYDRVNDHWRTTAYRKAIRTLQRQKTKITTEEEAFRLPNIGSRLAQKIEEIVTTNKLKRLEYAQAEPMDEVLQLFLGIYGVGTSQAQKWISQGHRTLQDLKERANLTPNQLIGVEHYDDLNTRIPRQEVEALGAVVRQTAERIDSEVELIIGGSYRRGAETSGDIDFIITKRKTESTAELRRFLDELVTRLEAQRFLVARLASSRAGHDGSKWHGCCVLPPTPGINDVDYRAVWRRIDFLLVPATEIGAALIYFTGNDIFNRSIRLLASKKGMRLNQRGLYRDVTRGPQRVKVTEGELVEGRDERRIFEILGVHWREPHERWC